MAMARVGMGLMVGALLFWSGTASVWAAPTAAQVLGFRPRQEGVNYSTPTAQEEATCKVELVKGAGKGSGWLLRDPKGLPLRRFFDSNGDGHIDVWSYYKDGVEVYRETDTDFNGKPDQYRWMNAGGTRWGVDANEDGRIDTWQQISPEEVGQEVLTAVATHDMTRLQALLLSDAEIKALELPAAEASRIVELRKQIPAKFQATVAKLAGLSEKTHWVHLETPAPICLPHDQTGSTHDLIKYNNATILCETAGKNDWLQTGELIQVGAAWRIVDAPTAGAQETISSDGQNIEVAEKELQPLLDQLRDIDLKAPKGETAGASAEVARYNLERADLLERIVAAAKPEKRDPWIRQLADCLSTAAQATPATAERVAYKRLQNLEDQITKAMAGSNLAAYITYREMTTDYSAKLAEKDTKLEKVQEQWVERLSKFVQTYGKADDTADALLQLGMVSEFIGKEIEAKKWYQQLATNFPDKPIAKKAEGAQRRLELEGKPLELASATLEGTGTFDISKLQGKILVVYYWASWNQQCVGDFAKLKLLLEANAGKVELVTVNLDNSAEEALTFLKRSPAPGTHLFQPGGLESPLAVQYGIMGLPNLFLVNKDGKVASRSVQISTLEDELRKLQK